MDLLGNNNNNMRGSSRSMTMVFSNGSIDSLATLVQLVAHRLATSLSLIWILRFFLVEEIKTHVSSSHQDTISPMLGQFLVRVVPHAYPAWTPCPIEGLDLGLNLSKNEKSEKMKQDIKNS